jgi:serine/threonine protein kinase
MSYCLNPTCPNPENANESSCVTCHTRLLLNNRYLALHLIGQGGFGRTLLAIDTTTPHKKRCVIKQSFPQQTEHLEKASALFKQEAEQLKILGEHPQIPDLFDYLEQDQQQYLIQEWIDGDNLAQELSKDGAFTEEKIRSLLNDLLPVLQYVHEHHVIHRDIKPANIIRKNVDQKLYLVDLGAAKSATGTALAKTGTVIGSAEYVAPEQSRGRAIFASDLYSLGATCITLFTNLSPFDLYDMTEDRWIWRNYLSQTVSDQLAHVLDRLLESATNRRYESAAAVLAALSPLSEPAFSSEPREMISSSDLQGVGFAQSAIPLSNVEFRDPDKPLVFEFSALAAPIIPVNAQNIDYPSAHQPIMPVYDGSPASADRRWVRVWLIMMGVGFLVAIGIAIGETKSSDPPSPPQETQQNQ